MKIQVIGSGCPTCQKLHEVVLKAAQALNLEKQVEYVSGPAGITKIIELGAMSSPVLAIDDQIVMTGFNGDVEKIKSLISGQTKKIAEDCGKDSQCPGDDEYECECECECECDCDGDCSDQSDLTKKCQCGGNC